MLVNYKPKNDVMNWNESNTLIHKSIRAGTYLNPNSQFRRVVEVYNRDNTTYFRVQIGASNSILITMSMLEILYNASIENGGIYNRNVFKYYYPKQLNNHPCHVHVVGKIFQFSGVMIQCDKRNYQIQ